MKAEKTARPVGRAVFVMYLSESAEDVNEAEVV